MNYPIQKLGLAMLLLISVPIVTFAQTASQVVMVDMTEQAKLTQEQVDAQILASAWQEYYNSWNELDATFSVVTSDWQEVATYWDEISTGWAEINASWDTVSTDWQELDQSRLLLSNSLGITLTDAEARLTRESYPRSSFQTITRTVTLPTVLQQTGGSWAELDSGWDTLNAAWSSSDAAFAELNSAWAELNGAYTEISTAWTFVDPAFEQIRLAFDAVDAAWIQAK